jgi:hypothetical protein
MDIVRFGEVAGRTQRLDVLQTRLLELCCCSRRARLPDVSASVIDKQKFLPKRIRDARHLRARKHDIPTMAQRAAVKTTYEVERTLQPIYSGGSLSLSADGRILAASLGEDVLLTDLTTGKELGRVEGDGEAITAMACKCVAFARK